MKNLPSWKVTSVEVAQKVIHISLAARLRRRKERTEENVGAVLSVRGASAADSQHSTQDAAEIAGSGFHA